MKDFFFEAVISIGVVATVLSIVFGITFTVYQEKKFLTEMVRAGADPIRAACALTNYPIPCLAATK